MIILIVAFFFCLAILILTMIWSDKVEKVIKIRRAFRKKYLLKIDEIGLPTFYQMVWNPFVWTFKGWEKWLDRKGRRK